MGLISAASGAVSGTLADQWVDFFTAPAFDERTLVAPAVFQGRRGDGRADHHVVSDGARIAVPEQTAVMITDGGRIASVSTEPGYFVYRNDGQPSLFSGGSIRKSLIGQSWERFKFGGQPGQQQLIYFVNLREVRGIGFGTPGPLAYKDFSLVPPGSPQVPVLRIKARGSYSLRVADPIRFFQAFVPANVRSYSLDDPNTAAQLAQEFIAAFQAALQGLSSTTDIATLTTHGPQLAAALTNEAGPGGSWLERFGLEVVSAAVSAIEYDDESRQLMDKFNQGAMLGGSIGNAYAQTTVADAALAAGQDGGGEGLLGVAMGVGALGGTLSGLQQPSTAPAAAPDPGDPVATLAQLKSMLDQGLISPEQYAEKQQEVLGRM